MENRTIEVAVITRGRYCAKECPQMRGLRSDRSLAPAKPHCSILDEDLHVSPAGIVRANRCWEAES